MEKQFIKFTPHCDNCGGQLTIDKAEVDMVNAMYILFTSCLLCGEELILTLDLLDFIQISQKLLGGSNENN